MMKAFRKIFPILLFCLISSAGWPLIAPSDNFGVTQTPVPYSGEIPRLSGECSQGDADSCYKVGLFYQYVGNLKPSIDYYQLGCEKGLAKSCHNWGVLELSCHTMGLALEPFTKGCDLQFGASCFNLAMLDEKLGRYDDAAKNYQLACSLGIQRGCERYQHLPVARVVMPAYRFVMSKRLLYLAVLMVISLFIGELIQYAANRQFFKRPETGPPSVVSMATDYPVTFETRGKLLLSSETPAYLFIGALISFIIFLQLFRYSCTGFGALAPFAIAFLLSTCFAAFHKNLLVLQSLRVYRVMVTSKTLALRPTISLFHEIRIPCDQIENVLEISKRFYKLQTVVLELRVRGKNEPLRLAVKDPKGLLEALKGAVPRRNGW